MHFKISNLFIFVIFLSVNSLAAQDAKPRREVGLQFNNFDFDGGGKFSAIYKKQKKENVYRRIRFFYGDISLTSRQEVFQFGVSAGIAIGREKRKMLDSKLEFYQGPEFALKFVAASLNENEFQGSIAPSFGWVLGLQHSLNDRWAVNLETVPSASISFSGDTNSDDNQLLQFGAGFSNTVSLGLVRKF